VDVAGRFLWGVGVEQAVIPNSAPQKECRKKITIESNMHSTGVNGRSSSLLTCSVVTQENGEEEVEGSQRYG